MSRSEVSRLRRQRYSNVAVPPFHQAAGSRDVCQTPFLLPGFKIFLRDLSHAFQAGVEAPDP